MFRVRVRWPEGQGFLTRLPGGGTGIGAERVRTFVTRADAEDAAETWRKRISETQARQRRATNHQLTIERS